VNERPILFSGAMVRAIVAGQKTVTRRVLNPQPTRSLPHTSTLADVDIHHPLGWRWKNGFASDEVGGVAELANRWTCPYGSVGDRLWVRETWTSGFGREGSGSYTILAADGAAVLNDRGHEKGPHYNVNDRPPGMLWRPSIFMPRWASRINLEITEVRAHRLQEISEADSWAEGVEAVDGAFDDAQYCTRTAALGDAIGDARPVFSLLWDSINGKRPGCSWHDNPWVWAVSFKRLEATK
jgi:hypothetical protein